jgi:hypothetical protein
LATNDGSRQQSSKVSYPLGCLPFAFGHLALPLGCLPFPVLRRFALALRGFALALRVDWAIACAAPRLL